MAVPLGGLVAVLAAALPAQAASSGAVSSGVVRASAPATAATITGSGSGHGIGLSQWGAYAQAVEGRTGEQIAGYYYSATTVAAYDDASQIRVNVAHGVTGLALHTLAAAPGGGHWRVTTDAGAATAAVTDLGPSDAMTVGGSDAAVRVAVTRADGVPVAPVTATSVDISWAGAAGDLAGEPATVLVSGSDQLRHGTLSVRPSSAFGGAQGRLEAVNSVRLHDEYLYGIAEVPSSWPREALRAQAIAARTYALDKVLRSPAGVTSCGYCHVYDSTLSQVFTGWKKENESSGATDFGAKWREAVDSTAVGADQGLTVLSSGTPIQAYFFSSSGGKTRNSEDVWSAALPYTRSVDDHWSLQPANPNAAWSTIVDIATLASAFELPDIAAVNVDLRDVSGAVERLTAVSSAGLSSQLTGEAFRSKLGLKSAWLTVALTVPLTEVAPPPPPPPPHVVKVPPQMAVVYTRAGPQTYRGRAWSTTCSDYGTTHRCLALVTASHPVRRGRTYASVVSLMPSAWGYTAVDSPAWSRSPYATPGSHLVGTHRWTTTCDVPTGPRLCRASLLTKLPLRTVSGKRVVWAQRSVAVLNRIVRLTDPLA